MCPFIKDKCPKNDVCNFWLIPGELPLINAKSSDKFPARGMCLFHMGIVMLWDANVNIIGTQQATESFRNGMIENDGNGKTRPKSDLLTATLLKVLTTKPLAHLQMAENLMIEGEYEDTKDN